LTKILENAVEALAGMRGQITAQTRNLNLTEATQDRNLRLNAGIHVCVEINDNGKGIEPDVLPKIFEPFFTTKRAPHRGLGLALAYGIVTNHGGGVVVTSQQGTGTSARIYLPAERQLIDDGAGSSRDLYGKESVLVVDDESLLLTAVETILTGFGYKVLTANSGQKALSILTKNDVKVDVVLTDLVMPGMGGRELAERIRQMSPDKKVVLMSGYLMPSDTQPGTMYLQKPFTSHELLEKVRQAVAPQLAN
jgi:CheY-like chemotaxis protein